MVNPHENSNNSQIFSIPSSSMNRHDLNYGSTGNGSPTLPREYSLLQSHSDCDGENIKIEYVNVTTTDKYNGGEKYSTERYDSEMATSQDSVLGPYATSVTTSVASSSPTGRIKSEIKAEGQSPQGYVTLPPFLN